ncbi:MAG: hypothetical protein JWM85_2203, partial [Acidimicrobiaceae bacterium]|nr:hypothetical protein [Acidimicrobiaceae bacterium]
TLYAQWVANAHTVTFSANGGKRTMSSEVTNTASALSTSGFTASGFRFGGWNTAADGSGVSYSQGASYAFTADTTLYAQWVALPTTAALNVAPPPSFVPGTSFGSPTSVTVGSTGGATTLTQTVSGMTATVVIPPNALPAGTTVSIYPVASNAAIKATVPSGRSYVSSFAVSWQSPGGGSPVPSAPITLVVSDPKIVPGQTVYEITPKGLVAVGTATRNGTVAITFVDDPVFVVAGIPKLVITSKSLGLPHSTIELKLKCVTGISCDGTVEFSVARRTLFGTRTIVSHVVVARGIVSISHGKTGVVVLHVTTAGKSILLRGLALRHFRVSLLDLLTGRVRTVSSLNLW